MSESFTPLRNTNFSFKQETTEGTAPTDVLTDAVLLRTEGISWSLPREIIEDDYMQGSLSKGIPQVGMYGDLGFVAPVWVRGSGTQNTAPDYSVLLKTVMGGVSTGVNGTVKATPTPTTTGFTVTGTPTVVAGHLIRVEVGASYEIRRVLTAGAPGADVAVTVWPPLSAAPSTAAAVQCGVAHLLKSDFTDFVSGCGFFYFDGDKKLVMPGSRGSAQISMTVGQKASLTFNMMSMSYTTSYTAIGYTPTLNRTTKPPICLGISFDIIYAGIVAAGSTTTSVKVSPQTGCPALEIAVGDTLIVDVGASSYETKTVTVVSGSGSDPVTCTTAAFSGMTPTEDCYVKRSVCIPSLEINLENEFVKNECMTSTYGVSSIIPVGRTVNVNMPDKKFRSFYDLSARDGVVSTEIWAILGDTAGNIIAMCIPKFYPLEVGIEPGDALMTMPVSGRAGLYSSGDDEFFITHL